MVARAVTGFGLTERAAEFLAQAAIPIGGSSILVHGKTSLTDRMTGREIGERLCIALVQGDNSIPMVDVFNGVIDMLGVITLVADESSFLKRNDLVCFFEDCFNHGGIHIFSGGSEFIDRQPRNAIDQDVILVAPVKRIVFLITLV